jgi:DNA-binding transcriptional LysR family regulator
MNASESLKGIAPFVCVADAGSFAAAAAQLNLTGSAVSKSIARLEQRLGARLFERTTRSLALTDAGHAFYATCVRILRDLAEAEAVLAAHKVEPGGRVRIDLPATFGRLVVMPVLQRVCAQFPSLRPHVTFTDRFVDIIEEGVDVAVRIGGQGDWPASVAHAYLGRERLIFCSAPAYLARRGAPATTAELSEHDCVCYGKPDGSISPWTFVGEDGALGRQPVPHRLAFGDAEAQVAAVAAGLGVAQLATWLVGERLRSGELVEVLDDAAADGLPLYVTWSRARQLLPKVDAFVQALCQGIAVQ